MSKLDYFEFKATKANGEIVYSTATYITLPPYCHEYVKIEVIYNYTNGETTTKTLKDIEQTEHNLTITAPAVAL